MPKKNALNFYFNGQAKMRRGIFEADTVNLFLSEFRNCSMFIDVGAHHGYFSCLANSAGVPIITSIEPDTRNLKY
jgi:hypothetical protein